MLQLTMWYLLNIYMCEKVHVRAYMQCWREFAKCRFTHFPHFSQSMLTPMRWYEATDTLNMYARVVMLDLSKALDLINHHILLDKAVYQFTM